MKNKNIKNITIEYYNTCTLDKIAKNDITYTRKITDISLLLEKLKNKNVQDRTIDYNGEKLLLGSIEFNTTSKLWELIFFKSRSSTVPFIINKDGNSRKILLKDDEMISEVLCVLYNADTEVLAMQRNSYSVGTKGLEDFLGYFLSLPVYLESLQTIDTKKKTIIKNSKIKKFKLCVRNVKKRDGSLPSITQYNKNTSICKVIDSALAVNSAIINIEFSMGNSSNIINVEDDDFEVFQNLINNSNVKRLELG